MGAKFAKQKAPKKRGGKPSNTLSALKKKPLTTRAKDAYLSTDFYAEPIRLNFRGNENFASVTGAILSTLVRISILIFAATRALSIVGF